MNFVDHISSIGINCIYAIGVLILCLLLALPTLLPRIIKKHAPRELSIGAWFAAAAGYVFSLMIAFALFTAIYNVLIHNEGYDAIVKYLDRNRGDYQFSIISWCLFGRLDLEYPQTVILATELPFASHVFTIVTSVFVGNIYVAAYNLKFKRQSTVGGILSTLGFVIILTLISNAAGMELSPFTIATVSYLFGIVGASATDKFVAFKKETV